MSFFQELKRRNVFRVGIAYAVASWLLLQLTEVLSELLELQADVGKVVIVLLLIGFPIALFFAWAFELTPDGVKREKDVDRSESITRHTGRRLNHAILVLLVGALAYFIWESRFATREPAAASRALPVQPADRGPGPTASRSEAGSPPTQPAPARAGNKSIAVLPFTHRSPDPDDIYFTDGIHDDLLTQLAKIGDLSVISRTSVLEYRDTTKNLKQIGKELGVANIMEGAVQRAGERVRINVQLIDADTDEHLWAETYDRQLTTGNLFDIQSEISRAIASALKATLTEQEIASVTETPTDSVQAYELYLQARRFALGETLIGYATAIDLLEEALELDPAFKLAWVGLAYAHISNYWIGSGNPEDRAKAWQAIEEARALDPDFPELHMALGAYHYWGFLDYDTALENLDQAIRRMPGNAEAHMWRGWALRRAGRWQEAVAAMRESLRLDPRVRFNWVELGQTLCYLHRFDACRQALERARELDRDDFWAKQALANLAIMAKGDVDTALTLTVGAQHTDEPGWVATYMHVRTLARRFGEVLEASEALGDDYGIHRSSFRPVEGIRGEMFLHMGRDEEAAEEGRNLMRRAEELETRFPGDYRLHEPRALAHALIGEPRQTLDAVRETIESRPVDGVESFLTDSSLVRILALAGLAEQAVAMLEEQLEPPGAATRETVRLDPAFDRIREHPAFIALLERHQ